MAPRLSPAAYALAGALLGATASLMGVYITAQQEATLDTLATKRDVYAAFAKEASEYGFGLRQVQEALEEKADTELWDEVTAKAQEEGGDLYFATSVVIMTGSPAVATAAIEAQSAMFSWQGSQDAPVEERIERLRRARDDGYEKLVDFLKVAREDLQSR